MQISSVLGSLPFLALTVKERDFVTDLMIRMLRSSHTGPGEVAAHYAGVDMFYRGPEYTQWEGSEVRRISDSSNLPDATSATLV